jgi:hypothetical protein
MLFFRNNDLHAKNRVTIATVGGGGGMVNVGDNREPEKMVVQIIDFRKEELNKVLPIQPDLILLTEACDRPGGLTSEEQFNYFNRVRQNWLKQLGLN